ncbi:hypothetical protein CEE37_07670 [candidate division LCP-89 bacterium B3_LCP]|uniref:Uncharacterized protein n=1 Tax=candidate division LCP-89 bacterium B3_LCP TaxID=2012998 RepID=A0A532V0V5_UNCL8|nr:MAG: hypothetical protein CEE37_07670 [candidate division LCP-89 bacterium B3_LCP]
MQVNDSDAELLFGLFQSVCEWSLDRGFNNVGEIKDLCKIAMVDVCHQRHDGKPASIAKMATGTDLGISIRNVERSLNKSRGFRNNDNGSLNIRKIRKEIAVVLTRKDQTLDGILSEVSYLMHGARDLQKRTLKVFLQDMEKKNQISSYGEGDTKYYKSKSQHISMFDMTDFYARMLGVLEHVDAFNHSIIDPLYNVFTMKPEAAVKLQKAVNEIIEGTGNAYEQECKEIGAVTKEYNFFFGSVISPGFNVNIPLAQTVLNVINTRFGDPDSPSAARTHWYHLTEACAKIVFSEVCAFIKKEGEAESQNASHYNAKPFAFYFGLADRQISKSTEEI